MILPPPEPPPPAAPAELQEAPVTPAEAIPADVAIQDEQPPPTEAEQPVPIEPDPPAEAIQAPPAEEPPPPEETTEKPPIKRRNSWDSLEVAAQVHQVQEWLTAGKRPNQVRSLCAERWGLATRTAESRMQSARRQIAIDCNELDRRDMAATMIQRLEKVLEQAFEMNKAPTPSEP